MYPKNVIDLWAGLTCKDGEVEDDLRAVVSATNSNASFLSDWSTQYRCSNHDKCY